nr:MAG TPA: hypothetical protein [Caudoviricetes sp.]
MDSQRRKESEVREMKGFRNRNKKTSALIIQKSFVRIFHL